MDNFFVPQVDYTSRDYLAIRDDMTNLINSFIPQWTTRDNSDFGIVLLQMFSWMGDLMSYYIDRAANETFISTASQRNSVLRISSLLDYSPTLSSPSTVTLSFTNTDTVNSKLVPALTQVATTAIVNGTSTQIIFETDSAITIPANTISPGISVTATQGTTVSNEIVKSAATGYANQIYQLNNTSVIESSVQITIDGVSYQRVQYLLDYSGISPVFSTYTDGDGFTYVVFGDNIGGRIPPLNKTIYATYRVGGGILGNVSAKSLTYILTNYQAGLKVLNPLAATGGADPESTDSIRVNAPLSIKSLNRAVSLDDYASLTLQVSGVAKTNATAGTYSSVTTYIAPFGDTGVQPDNLTPTPGFNTLAGNVLNYMTGKAPVNTTLTVSPPSYVNVDAIINVNVLPQYRQTTVQQAVYAAILDLLTFDNVFFADKLVQQYFHNAISSINGVDYATINLIRRNLNQQYFNISTKAASGTTATLTTTGPIATITGASSGGTITSVVPGYVGSTPTSGKVTYYTTKPVAVGTSVTITSLVPTGYNGTFTVTDSTPYTSFSVSNATVTTVTDGIGSFTDGIVTYVGANTFSAGQTVSITGLLTTAFNLTGVTIATANNTGFTVVNAATGTDVIGANAIASTTANHNLTPGQLVKVSIGDTNLDGTYVVTGTPSATTFTYTLPSSLSLSSTSTSSSGTLLGASNVRVLAVEDITCTVNEIPQAGSITVTASNGITT
jgi:hypothetical protein